MTLKDQADFLIADTGIHGATRAWKLGASHGNAQGRVRVFSIQQFATLPQADNVDAAPVAGNGGSIPISFNRTAFGGVPVANGPGKRG